VKQHAVNTSMMLGILIVAVSMTPAGQSRSSNAADGMTQAQQDRWKTELSNWGRWGASDEVGALNLITPAKRRAAAALVTEGFSVSLARQAETEKAADNANPYQHEMLSISSDRISIAFHGQAHTHLDALSHTYIDGKAYNGYAPTRDEVMQRGRHSRNSIEKVKDGIFTRGVLIDLPRLKGVPYLDAGTPIFVEDLEAWEKLAGVTVGEGDALFVRTGRWVQRARTGAWRVGTGADSIRAGLHPSTLPWLKRRNIALLGGDIPQSFNPGGTAAPLAHAVHQFAPTILGVHLFDNVDLEALAEAAAARKRWTFLLTAAPLPIVGATGSPINPIATF